MVEVRVKCWVMKVLTKIEVQVCATSPPQCPVLCVTPPQGRLTVPHVIAPLKKKKKNTQSVLIPPRGPWK